MGKKYKTAPGGHVEIRSYLKRSHELWKHASNAYHGGDHDACVILVIHACISIADAACIASKQCRYAGTSHSEAVQFFHDLGYPTEEFRKAVRRFGQIIGIKTAAEYGGKNLLKSDAELVFTHGQRFRDYLLESILRRYE